MEKCPVDDDNEAAHKANRPCIDGAVPVKGRYSLQADKEGNPSQVKASRIIGQPLHNSDSLLSQILTRLLLRSAAGSVYKPLQTNTIALIQ